MGELCACQRDQCKILHTNSISLCILSVKSKRGWIGQVSTGSTSHPPPPNNMSRQGGGEVELYYKSVCCYAADVELCSAAGWLESSGEPVSPHRICWFLIHEQISSSSAAGHRLSSDFTNNSENLDSDYIIECFRYKVKMMHT